MLKNTFANKLILFLGGNNAEVFKNRKGYYSLNVQVVGNANLKFLDVVERWPGSAHDATIFGHSNLRIRFEAGHFPNSILLGIILPIYCKAISF